EFDFFIDLYNRTAKLSSDELTAVGIACRYLGSQTPALFKDALKAFDQAVEADSGNLEPRIQLGELFLDKYNSTDAQETFKQLLAINPGSARGLLGMARTQHFDGSTRAMDLAKASVK